MLPAPSWVKAREGEPLVVTEAMRFVPGTSAYSSVVVTPLETSSRSVRLPTPSVAKSSEPQGPVVSSSRLVSV
jgi:hypothetical protein